MAGAIGRSGGARPGAGRKPGSGVTRYAVKSAMAVADKIGLRPIDVMLYQLSYMHRRATEAQREFDEAVREVEANAENVHDDKIALLEKRFDQMKFWLSMAQERAVASAPYLHPRIASVTISGDNDNPIEVQHTIRVIADALDAVARAKLIEAEPVTDRRD